MPKTAAQAPRVGPEDDAFDPPSDKPKPDRRTEAEELFDLTATVTELTIIVQNVMDTVELLSKRLDEAESTLKRQRPNPF